VSAPIARWINLNGTLLQCAGSSRRRIRRVEPVGEEKRKYEGYGGVMHVALHPGDPRQRVEGSQTEVEAASKSFELDFDFYQAKEHVVLIPN